MRGGLHGLTRSAEADQASPYMTIAQWGALIIYQEQNMDIRLIGACGLYCGACDCHRVGEADGRHLAASEKMMNLPAGAVPCHGCGSEQLTPWCRQCAIRRCARDKQLTHCGECAEHPCAQWQAFVAEGHQFAGARHRLSCPLNLGWLTALGVERWLKEESRRWRCACGQAQTYYESHCARCGAPQPDRLPAG